MQWHCWKTCHVFSFCPTICIFCLLRSFASRNVLSSPAQCSGQQGPGSCGQGSWALLIKKVNVCKVWLKIFHCSPSAIMISSCIAMAYTACSHLLEHSLGRTSVKKTAKILVFWAIGKLCCWYLTVETAVGGEIGNFLAYSMLQKYSYLSIGPGREVSLGITNKIMWILSC